MFVQLENSFGSFHGFISVKRQTCVNFGGNISFDFLKDSDSEGHTDVIEDQINKFFFLLFIQLSPFYWFSVCSFLSAIGFKVFKTERDGVFEDVLKLRSFADLKDE